jgi:hypothetical protein
MKKPKDKDDKYFNEQLEALEGPVPVHLRQDIVKERRKIKKDRNRTRRNKEKRELLALTTNPSSD